MHTNLRVYSDGASRGNPGPSAIAFMILDEDGNVLKRHAEYLGRRTNNQAEYEALISALEATVQMSSRAVTCRLDSELVVKQLNGEYRVRDLDLRALWLTVRRLTQKFGKVTFIYTARTSHHIHEVDLAANRILDGVRRANG